VDKSFLHQRNSHSTAYISLVLILFSFPGLLSAYEFRASPLVSVVSGKELSSSAIGYGFSAGYGRRIIPGVGYLIEGGYANSGYEADSSFSHTWVDWRLEWALLPSLKWLSPYIGASVGVYRYEQKAGNKTAIAPATGEEKKGNCFGLGGVVGANVNLLPLIDLFAEVKARRLFSKDAEKFGQTDEDEWLITAGLGVRLSLSLFNNSWR